MQNTLKEENCITAGTVRKYNRILVVDDQLISAVPIMRMLKDSGYDICYVQNGEAAVSIVGYGIPVDLVVMDIDLGDGICGIAASTLINAIRNIPVLFFTSHPENYVTDRIGEFTYAGYLSKQSSAELFTQTVQRIIG